MVREHFILISVTRFENLIKDTKKIADIFQVNLRTLETNKDRVEMTERSDSFKRNDGKDV